MRWPGFDGRGHAGGRCAGVGALVCSSHVDPSYPVRALIHVARSRRIRRTCLHSDWSRRPGRRLPGSRPRSSPPVTFRSSPDVTRAPPILFVFGQGVGPPGSGTQCHRRAGEFSEGAKRREKSLRSPCARRMRRRLRAGPARRDSEAGRRNKWLICRAQHSGARSGGHRRRPRPGRRTAAVEGGHTDESPGINMPRRRGVTPGRGFRESNGGRSPGTAHRVHSATDMRPCGHGPAVGVSETVDNRSRRYRVFHVAHVVFRCRWCVVEGSRRAGDAGSFFGRCARRHRGAGQPVNQRRRRVAANSAFSRASSTEGPKNGATGVGPERKSASTLPTSPSPNSM
ncbi:hypothetical protein SAMN04490239_1533 [Rhodococcus koreensis]|uniref:Uncharacterized protein n=1 Tax=Rhodococcus koreensis TaxID=99653 RepID=A0A1H4LZ29_9NOCA|nr:hypothetical protein SAMN04490239_1533 [Rhodococcus koreensis]